MRPPEMRVPALPCSFVVDVSIHVSAYLRMHPQQQEDCNEGELKKRKFMHASAPGDCAKSKGEGPPTGNSKPDWHRVMRSWRVCRCEGFDVGVLCISPQMRLAFRLAGSGVN